jgi:two-component system, chemotaxis family, chemotaxis protein CheY
VGLTVRSLVLDPGPPCPPPMNTILVVDDSPTIRRMVRTALAALPNVTFVEAGSGLQAIETLAVQRVQAVVLDLNMPDMHGLEVLRFLRSHDQYRALPVVILTTRGDESSRAAALEAGASAYMTKPFSPTALVSSLRDLLVAAQPPRSA